MTTSAPLLTDLVPAPLGVCLTAGDQARDLMWRELLQLEYWRTWWPIARDRVTDALLLQAGDADAAPFLAVIMVLIVLAVVVFVVVLLRRRGRSVGDTREAAARVFDDETVLRAEDYRARAIAHQAQGRHDDAVLDAFRATAAAAIEDRLVTDAPDLTVHEVGAVLAGAYPGHAEEVRDARRCFERVRYGGARADAADARATIDLDAALTAEEPVLGRLDPAHPVAPR